MINGIRQLHNQSAVPQANARSMFLSIAAASVGQRVRLYWRKEDENYDGTVIATRLQPHEEYLVAYDDGETLWEELWDEAANEPLIGFQMCDGSSSEDYLRKDTTDA